jgi:hypothetical protein
VVYYSNGYRSYAGSCGSCISSGTPSKVYEGEPKSATEKPAEGAEKLPAPETNAEPPKTDAPKTEPGTDT